MPALFQMKLDLGLEDLNPIVVGEQTLHPASCFRPPMFNATVIYLCRRGCGVFSGNRGDHSVKAGEAFVVLPGEQAVCRAEKGSEWEYAWVGFNGKMACRFSALPPVFTPPPGTLQHLSNSREFSLSIGLFLVGDLLKLYAKLLDKQYQQCEPVQSALDYVEENYMRKIRVDTLSRNIGIEAKYLSTKVKAQIGMSLRSYITQTRIKHAKEYLRQGLGASEISRLCGFSGPSNFNKLFKAHCGMTPLQWMRGREPADQTCEPRERPV